MFNRGGMMKYLLTSAGIKNGSIHEALVELLGKPIAACNALCIPTAVYGHPMAGPRNAWRFISGQEPRCPMVGLGWKSVGVLELTALPSLDEERWVPLVRETDVLLVEGGDAAYLCHWMRASGLADLLPSLRETVWVGLSAGSMVMTPRVGDDFVQWHSPAGDRTLGVVDFSIFPHVGNPDLPENTMAAAEKWAASISGPAYAIDDETAIKVVDGGIVEVVSEGHWKLFTPQEP
jgi:dipeptidase E